MDLDSPWWAQTQTPICVEVGGAGTWGGWRPGRRGCRRPAAQPRCPRTPRLLPAVTSCPRGRSGGRCHSGSGCSEQLCVTPRLGKVNDLKTLPWQYYYISIDQSFILNISQILAVVSFHLIKVFFFLQMSLIMMISCV